MFRNALRSVMIGFNGIIRSPAEFCVKPKGLLTVLLVRLKMEKSSLKCVCVSLAQLGRRLVSQTGFADALQNSCD